VSAWRRASKPSRLPNTPRAPEGEWEPSGVELWDVAVIGGGNAGLNAAITARLHGGRVLLVERSPIQLRGGNTRHTRDIRCVRAEHDAYSDGSYLYEELWEDLARVGTGPSNEKLAALTVAESEHVLQWMGEQGVLWQKPLSGTLHLGRTNRFFLGGGKALLNTYYRRAQALGVKFLYGATVVDWTCHGPECRSLIVDTENGTREIRTRAVVCASGGFEANLDWLAQYWGDAAYNFVVRGPATNDGTLLRLLYDNGAESAGEEQGFHAVAVDARSPRFDGGIATRLDTIPFGVAINRSGDRFYDEGEDLWTKRYAIWGRKIAEQDGQIAFSIWDSQVNGLFLPPMYGPVRATTVAGVADQLGIDPEAVTRTVARFNASVHSTGKFDPTTLDGRQTTGLMPPKSNWARPITQAPFFGIAMRTGVTFTYHGVAVDLDGRILRQDGTRFRNVFAAGEIMSGNILSSGYLAGFGLTIGTVWGRIAGRNAASTVL
jgi:tricarballylate dehydrogenase